MRDTERKVIFNHGYVLRHDLKRTYIYDRKKLPVDKEIDSLLNRHWFTKIHPLYAMVLSFASEAITVSELIMQVAHFLEIGESEASRIVLPFLDQEQPFYSHFGDVVSQFPKNILIDVEKAIVEPEIYTPKDFYFESIDLKTERALYAPRTMVFMPNNTCTTNCVYCYADRSIVPKAMDFQRVQSIIEECRHLHMMDFSITGGDIFIYKYWRELLACINENGFQIGLLSTKTPLQKADIELLKKYDVNLQFSLDTMNPTISKQIVGMNSNYLEKVKQMFTWCDEIGLKFKVATVLTTLNEDPMQLEDLYTFLQSFQSFHFWEIRLANKSLYSKQNFDELRLSNDSVQQIDKQIKALKEKSKVEISWFAENIKHFFKGEKGSKSFAGARCSANYSNMMVLPDGKVTICEQLYWNPRYIIGDLTQQSITDVWNSPRALELAFPKREQFRESSPCKHCKLFEDCYAYPNHCIVDILKGYGKENDDYPDPRCQKAPNFIYELCPI